MEFGIRPWEWERLSLREAETLLKAAAQIVASRSRRK